MAAEKTAVGIDLGTTYSFVGVFQHGKVSHDDISVYLAQIYTNDPRS